MRKEVFDKIYSALALLLLTVMLVGIANTACNTHMHILSNGEIIVHAHPTQPSEKSHGHSGFELLALDVVESEFASFSQVAIFFTKHLLSVVETPYGSDLNATFIFYQNGRAPPFTIQPQQDIIGYNAFSF